MVLSGSTQARHSVDGCLALASVSDSTSVDVSKSGCLKGLASLRRCRRSPCQRQWMLRLLLISIDANTIHGIPGPQEAKSIQSISSASDVGAMQGRVENTELVQSVRQP